MGSERGIPGEYPVVRAILLLLAIASAAALSGCSGEAPMEKEYESAKQNEKALQEGGAKGGVADLSVDR
jgi:hypothetical protein